MKLSTILKEKELKESVNVIELDKDCTSSKYRNSQITDFFPKVEKSDVLILKISNLGSKTWKENEMILKTS